MGVVHISQERNKAVIQLDSGELLQTIAALQSAVNKLSENPLELAKIWKLANAAASSQQQQQQQPQQKPITVVTPSAAALKQRLGVDHLDLGTLTTSDPDSTALQPTPPPWYTAGTAGGKSTGSLAQASRGFGQSLEDAYASGLRAKEILNENGKAGEKLASTPAVSEPKAVVLPQGGGRAQQLRRFSPENTSWKGCYQTLSSEHNHSKVTSIVYCPVLETFSGDWEQKGWLISTSSKLLNLWVCSRKPVGQPLELMHSQPTNTVVDAMDIDSFSKVLITVGTPQARAFRISLYSLSAETFFKHQGAIQIPDRIAPLLRSQVYGGPSKLVSILSLEPFKGPIKTAFVVGVGGEVLVYEQSAASSNSEAFASPKAWWKAHDAAISCMHASRFSCDLITGASDGSIKLWDMRNKPTAPTRQFAHQKEVTGVAMLDSNTLTSCGADSCVKLWDLRSDSGDLTSIVPDGKAILNMASAPNLLAVTTKQGLYSVEFSGQETSTATTLLSPLRPLPPSGPCTRLQWNTLNRQVYAAGVDGSISVFGNASG